MSTRKEKQGDLLPTSVVDSFTPLPQPMKPRKARAFRILLAVTWVAYCTVGAIRAVDYYLDASLSKHIEQCPQASVLVPDKNRAIWNDLSDAIGTDVFKVRAVDWLAGAVKVPTESYDDLKPVGQDPRWDIFALFHDYLLKAYPQVHAELQVTKVNTYGLLYTWKGSNASLKPVLLAAHQDVVPVNPTTLGEWTHPPYSGHFDGERLWGRGSADDKGGLIGILSTVEYLLESNFRPSRTVVLAFGFDEEVGGTQGAAHLASTLLDTYGEDAFAFVIDEGGGFSDVHGSVFAIAGIAEKGGLDVRVEVNAPGGHSSIPPSHTSIGILAALLVKYEDNPYKVRLSREDPLYSTLQCYADHARVLPPGFRRAIRLAAHSKKGLKDLEKAIVADPVSRSLVGTTQAVDLIQGGVKTNALPEKAWAVINHRVAVISSIEETKTHDTALLTKLASQFNLTYNAFGTEISEEGAPSSGTLTLSDAFGRALAPAPVTPTRENAAPYQLLSGTIKAAYNSHRSLEGNDNIFVAPGMPSGNTDTRYYWNLSHHIFRYNHNHFGGNGGNPLEGIHTVNEYIVMDDFLEMIRFFTTLILNADESRSL